VSKCPATSAKEVETAPIGEREEDNISRTITSNASRALQMIALCYRDLPTCPPKGMRLLTRTRRVDPALFQCLTLDMVGQVDHDDLTTDLMLISIIGIEDPLRTGVREADTNCGMARNRVIMCTGERVLTAKSIAQECRIYTAGGILMEGPHFRSLSPGAMNTIVPRLQVLAWSSPEDKGIWVEKLKELGDVVAVTGEGTNDGPALKTTHVGFSMGLAGTEVAKGAFDIILMDDAFPSIV
jgi:Ca2+-transporting ATPase